MFGVSVIYKERFELGKGTSWLSLTFGHAGSDDINTNIIGADFLLAFANHFCSKIAEWVERVFKF